MVVNSVLVVLVSGGALSGMPSGVSIGVSSLTSVFVIIGVVSGCAVLGSSNWMLPGTGVYVWLAAWESSCLLCC